MNHGFWLLQISRKNHANLRNELMRSRSDRHLRWNLHNIQLRALVYFAVYQNSVNYLRKRSFRSSAAKVQSQKVLAGSFLSHSFRTFVKYRLAGVLLKFSLGYLPIGYLHFLFCSSLRSTLVWRYHHVVPRFFCHQLSAFFYFLC